MTDDNRTAEAFATSWNNLPGGSVYTIAQFEEWLEPLEQADVEGRDVLELGCGNGSLLVHMARWSPGRLEGVDLGESVLSARANMEPSRHPNWEVFQADLTSFQGVEADLVYCIGVLHHLAEPRRGFEAVLRNVKPGGRFHCWVYGHEGNFVIRLFVEPLRRLCSRLPWWFTKYCVATPAVVPYFLYAKALRLLPRWRFLSALPLYDYALWIGSREFKFFRHVAFDQLVTPRTVYLQRSAIEEWLREAPQVDQQQTYVEQRNGNSWKFGGVTNERAEPTGPRPASAAKA